MGLKLVGVWPLGLNREQAAAFVGVGVDTFDSLVKENVLPQPVKLKRRTVWDRRRLTAAFDRLQGLSPQLSDDPEFDDIMDGLENV